MNRSSRPEELNLYQQKPSSSSTSVQRARSRSSSIDYPLSSNASTTSISINPLINVHPEPAYIAPSAATSLVTSDHAAFFESLHQEGIVGPDTPTMFVTEGSLRLVNQFLDFLLYSFLAAAKSTSLTALRPAVEQVLRLRLAKEAVAGADQELRSYLGGDDDGEYVEIGDHPEFQGEWDLESAWRKARVQCMVYSSLGDLEEDDEAFYSEQGLEGNVGPELYRRQSTVPGVVSPAVAVWLTSIVEFIGEQTLLVAGHATIARYSAQRIAAAAAANKESATEGATFPERPMVEELDTEKVALNPSLGRMWRQWRKKVRGRGSSISVPRIERKASLASRVSDSGSELMRSDTISSRAEDLATDEKPASSNLRATNVEAPHKDALLTPIAETATPRLGNGQDKDRDANEDEAEAADRSPGKKRPRSLIMLAWTTVAPFVLTPEETAIRRVQSLPDLKRGDFADPDMEGKEAAEEKTESAADKAAVIKEPEASAKAVEAASEDKAMAQEEKEEEGEGEEEAKKSDDETVAEKSEGFFTPAEEVQSVNLPVKPAVHEEAAAEDDLPIQKHDDPDPAGTGVQKNTPAAVDTSKANAPDTQTVPEPRFTPTGQHSPGYAQIIESPVSYKTEFRKARDTPIHFAYSATPVDQHPLPAIPPQADERVDRPQYPRSASDPDQHKDETPQRNLKPSGSVDEPLYTSHLKQSSTSSSRSQLSDRKIGQLTLIQTSSSQHTERRFTPPATPERSRRSSSFSKVQRPTHTSGSTSSSASNKRKNLIPWSDRNDNATKLSKPHPHDSDAESRSSLSHSERLAAMDDKERSFEELISGTETIKCTITPDNIRNMDIKQSAPRTGTSDLVDFFRSTGPDGRATTPKTGSRVTTSRSTPATPSRGDRPSDASATLPQFLSSVPAEMPQYTSSFKTERPSKAQQTLGTSAAAVQQHSSQGPTGLPAVIRQNRSDSPPKAGAAAASRPKNKLLAREASGSAGGDTVSALADFFRNTNPPANGDNMPKRRISRSVAPFRNTMDSAQFDTNSRASEDIRTDSPTNYAQPQSYQSSFTSSTALLRDSSHGKRDYGGTSMPDIKRKQIRNKDPYALDDLDDDDDDDMEGLDLVLPKKGHEESLVDFLNNVPPPPPQAPQPFIDTRTVQKKSSSVSLMSRFGRGKRQNSISTNADKVPQTSHSSAGPAPKYVPLTISGGADYTPRTSDGSYGGRAWENQHPVVGADRRPRPAQARSGRLEKTETDSLADFLKNTGPPEPTRQPQRQESQGVLKKMGLRGKKRNEVAGVV